MIRKRTKRSRQLSNAKGPEVIGVMPLEAGCGATTFSIMLANYFASKERKPSAIIWNRKERIDFLKDILDIPKEERLVVKGIAFLSCEETTISTYMNQDFSFLIWCFSKAEEEEWEEFLRCSRHFVVCNMTEWHEPVLESFVAENKNLPGIKRWKFLTSFGPEERRKDAEKKTGVKITRIPWCPDPFSIRREWFGFFESLL